MQRLHSRRFATRHALVLVAFASAFHAGSARAAGLGTPRQTGPFQITLLVEPREAHIGTNRFRVDLTRNGQPVADAKVTLILTMPLHRHRGRAGPEPVIETQLFASGDGYARFVNLGNNGPWQARVRVKAGGQKGSATYSFRAGKETRNHLGMRHPAAPFQVVLSTGTNAPSVGDNRFQVLVTRDGQPVTDARVNLALTLADKNILLALKPATPPTAGLYEGTATLPQSGDWEARINIQSGSDWTTAFYQFGVVQKP